METLVRDIQRECTDRAITYEHRMTEMNDKLDQLLELVRGGVMSQLNDHEKRLDALENRRVWFAGWIAGAGAVGALVATLIGKLFGRVL